MIMIFFQFQPSHHQPPSNNTLNGYTSLDDVAKMSALLNGIPQHNLGTSEVTFPESNSTTNAHSSFNTASRNMPSSNRHPQTSPVITDLHEPITDLDINKDAIPLPNATNQPIPTTLTSLQSTNNNNNNKTIYGYVTQQQLANFGTNVALGKELNT